MAGSGALRCARPSGAVSESGRVCARRDDGGSQCWPLSSRSGSAWPLAGGAHMVGHDVKAMPAAAEAVTGSGRHVGRRLLLAPERRRAISSLADVDEDWRLPAARTLDGDCLHGRSMAMERRAMPPGAAV